jgi:hypothetical protein
MMLTSNPTNSRLKYVWDKQKPQIHPEVMMDLISAVAERIMPPVESSRQETWSSRIEVAAKKADPKFAATFIKWKWRDTPINDAPYDIVNAVGDAGEVDVPFVNAVLAMVVDMSEFRKSAPIDGLIPWFAKQLSAAYRDKYEKDYARGRYEEEYKRLLDLLSTEPVLVEWFEKKKPNLSKMDASDVFTDIEAFEEDREPEVVYPTATEKTYRWAGWDVVKLATRTQIQKVGEELDNCLQKGSSYTEKYCAMAKSGESEFFALREDGEPVLSIQWTPGHKDPEQVYGRDNSEPEGDAAERVGEWIESRGGSFRKWGRLSRTAREIAEFIDAHETLDDESITAYATDWDNAFSVDQAKKWIEKVGAYSIDVARAMDDEKLDADDFNKLPDVVREYMYDHAGSKETSEIISLSMLMEEMEKLSEVREENRPVKTANELQQELSLGEQAAFAAIKGRRRADDAADADRKAIRKELKSMGLPVHGSMDKLPELMIEAKRWYDGGWSDGDYFDDAAKWWAHWFDPEDAAIYFFDLAHLYQSEKGITIDVAEDLRERGISAMDVADAVRVIQGTVNIRDADAVAALVEKGRAWLKANKRRRTSRRPARRR